MYDHNHGVVMGPFVTILLSRDHALLTFPGLEEREAELGDPERADEVDVDLLLDVAPRLPVELAAHAHARVVDQGVQTCNGIESEMVRWLGRSRCLDIRHR